VGVVGDRIAGLRPVASRAAASADTAGCSNSSRSGTSAPSRSASRDATWFACNDWPPRAKKLSLRPTESRPSTSATTSAMAFSTGETGASEAARARQSGSGSALRSTLPVRVDGNSGSGTTTLGTM
jgi:hypothetical protein